MRYPYHFNFPYNDWVHHLVDNIDVRKLPPSWLADNWDDGHQRDHQEYLDEMGMTGAEYDSWTNPRRGSGWGKI